MKTAHEWAIELTHKRINYGTLLEERPDILEPLKKTIFYTAMVLIEQVQIEMQQPPPMDNEHVAPGCERFDDV